MSNLRLGSIALDSTGAHHVRDVLRLKVGAVVELFDSAGAVAMAELIHVSSENVVGKVDEIQSPATAGLALTVAAAIPKADRADWMIEKLSELGVARFIPLICERSVVMPAGKNKVERWERIAVEAAKQSRRSGVMAIEPIALLRDVLQDGKLACYLSTAPDAVPAEAAIFARSFLLIGPEGGWSAVEMDWMRSTGALGVGLTSTILRVETAAIVAAGLFLSRRITEAR